jgi:predicted RNA-binding protein YlxR (DUF448 family)/ribosomal protein L7Ae-like RNA K-turn-binding protein
VAVRTCAGCRAEAPRDALLRFAIRPFAEGLSATERLVPDTQRRLPGRGVSVHPTRSCLEAATRKGGFAKALAAAGGGAPGKGGFRFDVSALAEAAAERYRQRVEGLLGAGARSRKVLLGTEAVRQRLRAQADSGGDGGAKVRMLVLARDAAGRSEELGAKADALGGRVVVFGDKSDLGAVFGRAELGIVAVLDEGLAEEVARSARFAADLAEAE